MCVSGLFCDVVFILPSVILVSRPSSVGRVKRDTFPFVGKLFVGNSFKKAVVCIKEVTNQSLVPTAEKS